MKENKNIEQLFRKEFESFEVQPSKKVWKGVRTDLFIKNFFHFSPWSVNAWYIGGVLIIASVAFFILAQPKEKNSPEAKTQIPTNIPATSDSLTSPVLPVREPGTLNLEPGTLNPEPGTLNLEPGTLNLEPGTLNPEPGIPEVAEKPVNLLTENIKNFGGQSVLAWFECTANEGCVPLSTGFRNFSRNAVRYFWSFGDGGNSELANPSYIFDEPGTWFISLTTYSTNNEISIFTDSIHVNPLPEARFSMDIQGLPGEGQPVYFYNYSLGAENYLWDFGDGSTSNLKEPDHYFSKKAQTDIKLLVFSAAGCSDSTILNDAFKEGEPAFIFPTAFSPNINGPGTGQYSRKNPENDVFFPFVKEDPEEYQLKIFNRDGILIFESTDIHTGWDGYYREELLPQGVYVWKARAKFSDGRSVVRIGDVTLLWGE